MKKIVDIIKVAKNSYEVLEGEKQALWTILRLSISQQLDYWLQLCYPSNIRAAAQNMDKIMWEMLEYIADIENALLLLHSITVQIKSIPKV